jgi:hypothetical protein
MHTSNAARSRTRRNSPRRGQEKPTQAADPRVTAAAQTLLDAFREGRLPTALASIFIRRRFKTPSNSWSLRNRILAAIHGHSDARGFRQWQEAGRHVRAGERAFYILGPRMIRVKEDRPERGLEAGDAIMVGVVGIPVFGFDQTEGDSLPEDTDLAEEAAFLARLPYIEVARAWGLSVSTYEGGSGRSLGYYSPSHHAIALGVRNLSTWAHELVHAADDRLQNLDVAAELDREVVAEFGATVLLECTGETEESDRGGAWTYISHYCERHGADPLTTCEAFLQRVVACVSHVIEAAEALAVDAAPEQ